MTGEKVRHYVDNDVVVRAICDEAFRLHDVEVNQKYDNHPYSYHLLKVVELALKHSDCLVSECDDLYVIVFGAAFHDAIEDARCSYNDIMRYAKRLIGEKNATDATEIVYALTENKGRNRAERHNDEYYKGIRNTKYAPYVKMCDRIANYNYSHENKSSMAKKYEQEMDELIEKIDGSENGLKYSIPASLLICTFK